MTVFYPTAADSASSLNGRTKAGLRFEKFAAEIRNMLDGKTPEDQVKAVKANQDFIKGLANPKYRPRSDNMSALEKAVTPNLVHVDSLVSTFSLMYANDAYIGSRLMPYVTVSKRSDKYATYPKRERLAFPEDTIGFRGEANEVDAGRSFANYSVVDYGLQGFVDIDMIQNQDAPLNELLDMTEQVMEGILFNEEKRIATIVQASSNYAGNTAGAGTKWDTAGTGGTIITDILAAKAALWRGRSGNTRLIGVTTLDNWNTCIINNPAIRDLFKNVSDGLVSTQRLANYLGLDEVLIAEAREDTANEGQTASYSRMWSTDFFSILAVSSRPTTRSAHFGSTFRLSGDPYVTQWTGHEGKRGAIHEKITVSEDHKVVAGDTSFLISDVKT
jgi:hypothetical protein